MLTNPLPPCSRCSSPLEPGDLRCALCGQAVPKAEDPRGGRPLSKIHRCDGCGAAVSYDAARGAPLCHFCGSTLSVESTEDPPEETEAYLPFTISQPEAQASLGRWLGSRGIFSPKDLRAAARVTSLQPLWWVGWVFEADAWLSWAADSDAGARRAAWAPHAGQLGHRFANLCVPATRGLGPSETSALMPSYDLSSAAPSPIGPEGASVERFDVQRSMARRLILDRLQGQAEAEVRARAIPGSSFRNVHVEPLLRSLCTRRLAFPAWVLAYRYRDKLYRAVVSGQGDARVTGNAPLSTWRILVAIGLAAALAVAVYFLVTGGN